jgi:hypothetical protein
MPGSSSKRRSRKRRNADGAPRAAPATRRERRSQRLAARPSGPSALTADGRSSYRRPARGVVGTLGREGERPPGPFGGLPVSEIAILVGIVGALVGFLDGGGAALIVGVVVCALGVLELTVREHFSGFRSHCTLLAAFPAAVVEGIVALGFGVPRQRLLILAPVVPVFALCFWLLRRRFLSARQRRIATRT